MRLSAFLENVVAVAIPTVRLLRGAVGDGLLARSNERRRKIDIDRDDSVLVSICPARKGRGIAIVLVLARSSDHGGLASTFGHDVCGDMGSEFVVASENRGERLGLEDLLRLVDGCDVEGAIA